MSSKKTVTKHLAEEHHRDPRLVALAERAEKAGLSVEWNVDVDGAAWCRLVFGSIDVLHTVPGVAVFGLADRLHCIGASGNGYGATPLAAMRAAYAKLGVALDLAEDVFSDLGLRPLEDAR